MKSVTFATTNKGKVLTTTQALEPYGITVKHANLEMPEIRSDSIAAIASAKAQYAFTKLKKPVITIDAGFWITSLNNFPGAYVNFALKTIGLDGLLRLTEGKDRSCSFPTCLAFLDDSLTKPKIFETYITGRLASERRGELKLYAWSELHYIFIPDGWDVTLAEMTPQQRQNFFADAHKNSYLAQFAKWFNKR